MIVRALFVLLAVLLVDVRAEPTTYLRTQYFESLPDNWIQTSPTQFYGYERTRIVGLTGAAGGLFQPGNGFNDYGDYFLGGNISRGTFLYAEGRLALKRASAQPPYRTTAYIGYFGRHVQDAIETVGLALIGHGSDKVYAAAVVEYANGKAYSGNWVSLPVGKGGYLGWKFFWNPSGGHGYGSLIVQIGSRNTSLYIPAASAADDFTLNAFGMFQPSFTDANANSFLWAYAGGLVYTAGVGKPPGIRASGTSTIRTSTSSIKLHGTASAARGYQLVSVKYRIFRDGKASGFRVTKGLKNWGVRLSLPSGMTRVQIVATNDSGLMTSVFRRIVRNP